MPAPSLCLACGEPLAASLSHCAALRCADCRDADAPIRADLLARLRRALRLAA